MKRSYFRFAVLELLLFTTLLPSRVDAAAAPYKVVYTFGGLNDRSGILWVARDAGFFTSTARPSSTCAMRRVGMSTLAGANCGEG